MKNIFLIKVMNTVTGTVTRTLGFSESADDVEYIIGTVNRVLFFKKREYRLFAEATNLMSEIDDRGVHIAVNFNARAAIVAFGSYNELRKFMKNNPEVADCIGYAEKIERNYADKFEDAPKYAWS